MASVNEEASKDEAISGTPESGISILSALTSNSSVVPRVPASTSQTIITLVPGSIPAPVSPDTILYMRFSSVHTRPSPSNVPIAVQFCMMKSSLLHEVNVLFVKYRNIIARKRARSFFISGGLMAVNYNVRLRTGLALSLLGLQTIWMSISSTL